MLRYDLRLVPAFVAANAIVRIVGNALLQGHRRGRRRTRRWRSPATVAVAWAITRYLLRVNAPVAAAAPRRMSAPRGRYSIVTQYGITLLSARCTAVTLLRVAHGITCRCSGR